MAKASNRLEKYGNYLQRLREDAEVTDKQLAEYNDKMLRCTHPALTHVSSRETQHAEEAGGSTGGIGSAGKGAGGVQPEPGRENAESGEDGEAVPQVPDHGYFGEAETALAREPVATQAVRLPSATAEDHRDASQVGCDPGGAG